MLKNKTKKNKSKNWCWILAGGSTGKESTCNVGDLRSIPGMGRSPGEGNSYPLQSSGLENSMDCIVPGVTKSQTGLSDFHFHFHATLAKFAWLFLCCLEIKSPTHCCYCCYCIWCQRHLSQCQKAGTYLIPGIT